MARKLKEGDLVWLDNPGTPYNDWNGASCVVEDVDTGSGSQYIRVRPIIAIGDCPSALFHPEQVVLETRPWLKKNLKQFIKMRRDLLGVAKRVCDHFGD